MEQTVRKNNIDLGLNKTNPVASFISSKLHMYIREITEHVDEIKFEKEGKLVTLHTNEDDKIIHHIIAGDIVLRNKKFLNIYPLLTMLQRNENVRTKFVSAARAINIDKMMTIIDEHYVRSYKMESRQSAVCIPLSDCGVPPFSVYEYLLSFEADSCNVGVDDNKVVLFYTKNNETYRIIMNDSGVATNLYYKHFCTVGHDELYSIAARPDSSFFCTSLSLEKKYIEALFATQSRNFIHELQEKYKHHQFHVGFISVSHIPTLTLFIY